MPCYTPLIREEDLTKWETAIDGHKYHPAQIRKATDDDITKYRLIKCGENIFETKKTQIIPCRKCIGCRLDYSRDWANRGFLETKTTNNNYWVNLTYKDEFLKINEETEYIKRDWEGKEKYKVTLTPDYEEWNGDLQPNDLRKFIHDLRQHMERKYNITGIKYMACGEYGERNKRPHYHIIFFNLNLPTETFYNSRIINNEFYWQNTIIERYWTKGISNITPVTWSNIAYTARYITKKIYGQESDLHYAARGQTIKEFLRVSKGIGKQYYEENKEQIYKRDEIIIHNKAGTVSSKPPKYYDNLYKKDNPEHWEEIQWKREKEQMNIRFMKIQNNTYTELERMAIEMATFEDKTAQLIRGMEREKLSNK